MIARAFIVLLAVASPRAVAQEKPAPLPDVTAASLDVSIKQGVDFLVTHQNTNGSWGNATKT